MRETLAAVTKTVARECLVAVDLFLKLSLAVGIVRGIGHLTRAGLATECMWDEAGELKRSVDGIPKPEPPPIVRTESGGEDDRVPLSRLFGEDGDPEAVVRRTHNGDYHLPPRW